MVMEEYVLDNGRIKLGPDCVGAVEFEDGHYEAITSIDFITRAHFRFMTANGLYSYKEWYEEDEMLYCDPRPYTFFHLRHAFGKFDYDRLEWTEICNITRVYVYKPAFSNVFTKEGV